MTHPLVDQLLFARKEFQRGLEGVSPEDAVRRVLPMNSISWNVGHLAWQEQRYWLTHMQGLTPVPELNDIVGYGRPASTPPLEEMWAAWRAVTEAAAPFLLGLTAENILQPYIYNGEPTQYPVGSRILRVLYHYWYHTGENAGIRQALGHTNLPEFVGDVEDEAPFRPS